jgi:UDP-N-acetylmuramyl pentapeptide phosphotransferase/UDP-N-acetylglucosamine-1-phosphate transferase
VGRATVDAVEALPLAIALLVAAVVAPPLVRGLREQGFVRENYRGSAVAFPAGIAIPVVALLALVPVSLVAELADADVFRPGSQAAVTYVIGVALLGLLDDLVGSESPARGWRGHARAAAGGGLSTGAVKAVGSLGLALFVLSGSGRSTGEYLLAVGVLIVATNLFNLLDLRPGRSAKALVLLGAGLTLGSLDADPLWTLGLFLGPVLLLLPLDLREVGMLGDTGSNAIGAVAGLWLVLTLSTTGQAIALAVMTVVTVYGEFRSIAALIDRTPGLRHLDSLGRTTHA